MNVFVRALFGSVLAFGAVTSSASAKGQIRISEQFGTLYVPFHILRDQGLIEKYGKEAGLPSVPMMVRHQPPESLSSRV